MNIVYELYEKWLEDGRTWNEVLESRNCSFFDYGFYCTSASEFIGMFSGLLILQLLTYENTVRVFFSISFLYMYFIHYLFLLG